MCCWLSACRAGFRVFTEYLLLILWIFVTMRLRRKFKPSRRLVGDGTCSNGLLVLMPFPPTKIQLSLKARAPTAVLPSSAISFLASSFSLQGKRGCNSAAFRVTESNLHVCKSAWTGLSKAGRCCGVYLVAGSSNEAIITTVPSSISFRNLMKGATSGRDTAWLTQYVPACF